MCSWLEGVFARTVCSPELSSPASLSFTTALAKLGVQGKPMIGDQGGWERLCKLMAALILEKDLYREGSKTPQECKFEIHRTGNTWLFLLSVLSLKLGLGIKGRRRAGGARAAGEACEPAAWLWCALLSVITSPFDPTFHRPSSSLHYLVRHWTLSLIFLLVCIVYGNTLTHPSKISWQPFQWGLYVLFSLPPALQ